MWREGTAPHSAIVIQSFSFDYAVYIVVTDMYLYLYFSFFNHFKSHTKIDKVHEVTSDVQKLQSPFPFTSGLSAASPRRRNRPSFCRFFVGVTLSIPTALSQFK